MRGRRGIDKAARGLSDTPIREIQKGVIKVDGEGHRSLRGEGKWGAHATGEENEPKEKKRKGNCKRTEGGAASGNWLSNVFMHLLIKRLGWNVAAQKAPSEGGKRKGSVCRAGERLAGISPHRNQLP